MDIGQNRRDGWSPLWFVLPYFVLFGGLLIYPLLSGIWLSLHRADFFGLHGFVGLENYRRLFTDKLFLRSLANTFYFLLLTVPALTGLGLALALALNRGGAAAATLRGVFFAPCVLSVTIVTLLWKMVFMSDGGLIANAMLAAGDTPISFLSEPAWALPAVAITTIWWCVGLPMVLFLAALQQVPKELYEAGALDGAGRWRTLFRITLPSIRRTIVLVMVMQTVLQFQLFGQAQLLTQGGPNNASRPIVLFIYEVGFNRWDVGYAAAASAVLFLFILLAASIQYRAARVLDDR